MRKIFSFISILCICSLSNSGITDIRIAYICPNDNLVDGIPSIPDDFLKRAKRNSYTHILVDYFLNNGTQMNKGVSDWSNGQYNNGIFTKGGIYEILKRDIAKVKSFGLDFIPGFGVGCVGAHWEEVIPDSVMDYYDMEEVAGSKNVVCIAPGKPDGTYAGQPDGFLRSFTHVCRVLNEACEVNSYVLHYIELGYTEVWQAGTRQQIWGSSKKGGGQSIDQKWLAAAPVGTTRTINDLVAASIEEKIDVLHNDVGGRLSSTKILLYGDMFSKTLQNAFNFNLVTNTFLADKKDNVLLKTNLVFMPWNYQRYDRKGNQYNTEKEFEEFTENGFNIIYCKIICDGDNSKTAETTTEDIPELTRAIHTAKKLQNNIIGYMSAHWDNSVTSAKGGYDNDLCWNGMEYLAYGNQNAHPETKFVNIPGGNFKNTSIPELLCSQTEITQGDYYSITGNFPFGNYSTGRLDMPVERISFYDAILYCNASSISEGLQPVYSYTIPQAGDFNNETCTKLVNLTADTSKNGYRLPSPVEWEYSYMAGTPTAFYWDNEPVKNYCWSGAATQPVGQLRANAFYLKDMAGNVEEMTCKYDTTLSAGYAGGCFSNISRNRIKHDSNIPMPKRLMTRGADWLGFRVVRKAPADLSQ